MVRFDEWRYQGEHLNHKWVVGRKSVGPWVLSHHQLSERFHSPSCMSQAQYSGSATGWLERENCSPHSLHRNLLHRPSSSTIILATTSIPTSYTFLLHPPHKHYTPTLVETSQVSQSSPTFLHWKYLSLQPTIPDRSTSKVIYILHTTSIQVPSSAKNKTEPFPQDKSLTSSLTRNPLGIICLLELGTL